MKQHTDIVVRFGIAGPRPDGGPIGHHGPIEIALLPERVADRQKGFGIIRIELLTFLCAAYVFGCAFRSVLPRADVQRICLFDTWLSSVLVGRSVATLAEVCFIIQWSIVLRILAGMPGQTSATL